MRRLDDLENGYRIWQDSEAFCFGIDAVLLAHYPVMKDGDCVMDLCTGNGVIPLIMHGTARDEAKRVSFRGLEIQEGAASLARESVNLNGLSDDIGIITGDVKEAANLFGAASFSLVTCNPPYTPGGGGLRGEDDRKTIARHEVLCTLSDVVEEASKLLKMKGRLAMIHRPSRLAEIFACMRTYGLEPKRMRMVYPFADKAPNLVLLEAVKGGGPQLNVDPPLIVYEKGGEYTREVLQIYGKI